MEREEEGQRRESAGIGERRNASSEGGEWKTKSEDDGADRSYQSVPFRTTSLMAS